MSSEFLYFGLFGALIIGILTFDLLVIGRKSHVISFKEALVWSGVWISIALLMAAFLYFFGERIHGIFSPDDLARVTAKYNPNFIITGDFLADLSAYRFNMMMEYLTGYLIEYSLSIDNVFVIIMILNAFSVQQKYYKRVLFWGILGAIILRFIFIFVGSALITKFEWILYIFGAFLIFTGIKMFLNRDKQEKMEPQHHWLVKWLSNHLKIYKRYVGGNFMIKKEQIWYITPLFIVLVFIEFTDLIFAMDSIPAVFAVTLDPYVVFFSNIFAIIGLRSLFFMLSKVVDIFHFLNVGISVLLIFVGVKLLFHDWLHDIGFNNVHSLLFIATTITLSIVFSILIPAKHNTEVIEHV